LQGDPLASVLAEVSEFNELAPGHEVVAGVFGSRACSNPSAVRFPVSRSPVAIGVEASAVARRLSG
nr:hypothetical protein [Microthrixaceae bacterium]